MGFRARGWSSRWTGDLLWAQVEELNGEVKAGHPFQTGLQIGKENRDPSSYKVKTPEQPTEEKP